MNIHTRRLGLLVLLVGLLPCRSVSAQHDAAITPELYGLVCDVTVGALPRPLQAFYRTHRDAVQQIAASADPAARLDGAPQSLLALRRAATSHFVWLDAAVPADGDAMARLAAAAAFATQYASRDVTPGHHPLDRSGTLPWALNETFHSLIGAFRAEDDAALIATTGVLIHLAVDAATPAQVTAWGSGERHRRAQARFAAAAARHSGRLVYEVRVSPIRFRVISDALEEVLDVVITTHRAAVVDFASVVTHDESGGNFSADDPGHLAHPTRDDDVWPGLLEDRLEAAAQLSARLIGTAWTRADLPQLPTSAERTTTPSLMDAAPPPNPGTRSETQPSALFVGTRTSKVFHRQGCPHVQRISPANVVTFSTPEEAIRAGRKACHTCSPKAVPPRP